MMSPSCCKDCNDSSLTTKQCQKLSLWPSKNDLVPWSDRCLPHSCSLTCYQLFSLLSVLFVFTASFILLRPHDLSDIGAFRNRAASAKGTFSLPLKKKLGEEGKTASYLTRQVVIPEHVFQLYAIVPFDHILIT